jgi:hypothetical protein
MTKTKWYIAPQTGDDSNDGKSRKTAVRTFQHLMTLMPRVVIDGVSSSQITSVACFNLING